MSEGREKTKQIGAWFLGPKAENANLEEEMILHILRDYFHWRRNYYPSDEITITQHMRRESLDFNDALFQQISEMLARLKRHFPFYSPRYTAHMLSDQTIPSVLGYFAGMLYNPNNVTPEAAPVTVEWELEVASDILRMVGYMPPPPPGAHHRETRKEFGWAHITSGGTVANLEALWVARNVRYFPLAVRKAAAKARIPLHVKLPGDSTPVALNELDGRQVLTVKPNEATFLLPRFIDAVRLHHNLPEPEACRLAWRMIVDTGLEPGHHGVLRAFQEWPPVVFASGTAHYSMAKAADILGIGRENLVLVDVDRQFRMDMRDLQAKVSRALEEGRLPLAVTGIAGTTEEGSVDPLDKIAEYRELLEAERRVSFWFHIDAAWSGYLRSLFVLPDGGTATAEDVSDFASRRLEIRRGLYERTVEMRWGKPDVCAAFLAFPKAESITVDPHKMGYTPYPAGVVAFRNDRVRHFLTQEAPYISTETQSEGLTHRYHPPRDIGPFVLEGSKPGAAAAAVWLSHRMIPPNRQGYGEVMRASVLAARELYERLVHWDQSCRANKEEKRFRFLPVMAPPPDTNIVCFVIQEPGNRSLKRMNEIGRRVYDRFTIHAERGERDYSYSQPYFLSRTRFHLPQYSDHSIAELLERAGVEAGEYAAEGIFVLRATVMSPYIVLNAESGHKQQYLAGLVEAVAQAAEEAVEASPAGEED